MAKVLPGAVAVIGAGQMGRGIAELFAVKGANTLLIDINQSSLAKGLFV